MTDQIRAAAQALLDAVDARHDQPAPLKYTVPYGAVVALRAALSAPQPAADDRVAELMRRIDEIGRHVGDAKRIAAARAAVESSARALLAAGREDAQDAARYRLLRCFRLSGSWPRTEPSLGLVAFSARYDDERQYTQGVLDALLDEYLTYRSTQDAIRAAMQNDSGLTAAAPSNPTTQPPEGR